MTDWRDIPGWEGLYEVSPDAQIRSKVTGRIRAMHVGPSGYVHTNLSRLGSRPFCMKAHRAVALAFIPNPDAKREVNHIDHNKANNHVSNLEWVTPKENAAAAIAAGAYKGRKLRRYTRQFDASPRACLHCGAAIERVGKRSTRDHAARKYCSTSCSNRDPNRRHAKCRLS